MKEEASNLLGGFQILSLFGIKKICMFEFFISYQYPPPYATFTILYLPSSIVVMHVEAISFRSLSLMLTPSTPPVVRTRGSVPARMISMEIIEIKQYEINQYNTFGTS